jgi:hypothetical protein
MPAPRDENISPNIVQVGPSSFSEPSKDSRPALAPVDSAAAAAAATTTGGSKKKKKSKAKGTPLSPGTSELLNEGLAAGKKKSGKKGKK